MTMKLLMLAARHIQSSVQSVAQYSMNFAPIVLGIAILNAATIGAANAEIVAQNLTQAATQQSPKSAIAQLELLPVRSSQVPADGRSTVKFEGRLLDKAGQVVPTRANVTLTRDRKSVV